MVIQLKVNEEAMVERITGRYACSECGTGYHDKFRLPKREGICDICNGDQFSRRFDDNEKTVRSRLSAYLAQTAEIVHFYNAKGILAEIDGMQDIEDVTLSIEAAIC